MPLKTKKPCLFPGCPGMTDKGGYCQYHSQDRARQKDPRPSASSRGYNTEWKKIRARVLRNAGIPMQDWNLYDVHHKPDYNPIIEPDHNKYELFPLLHGMHSSETGRNKNRGGGVKSLEEKT